MSKVVIFIPISREDHLDRLFASLEMLECDAEQTSLLTYVDGDERLFNKVRNMTQLSKFSERRAVRRSRTPKPATFALLERRKRIAAIKNESKSLIGDCDYVFGIEDDTIVPRRALEKLLMDYAAYPFAGFIEGVELGRWGLPYVGAWRADDVYEPTRIESLLPIGDLRRTGTVTGYIRGLGASESIEEIDAGGFYCYLTRRELYVSHDYAPFGNNDLGPDVDYGLSLRRDGYKNYIDWSINCEHRTRGGSAISLPSTQARQVSVIKQGDTWKQKIN